ncbi:unnamed protein product [Amoebophrya sp. A25]|nr:unnamed protein product [Amoebophrya sp. A25]|eukprot:GSA25T00010519001.1
MTIMIARTIGILCLSFSHLRFSMYIVVILKKQD